MLTFRQVAILLLIGPCGSVALRQRCVNEYGAGCKESKGSAAQPAETGVVPPGNLWRTLNLQIVRPAVDHLTARRELHKRFFPLELRDYLGFAFGAALATVALLVAAGGGVGGGSVLVPVYILVLDFSTGASVGLSNITILGGAIANLIFNAPRRHGLKDAPLIDWDLIMVMEPVTILGTILGGYLNKLTPGWLTTFLLALLMTFMTWKLAARGIMTWKAETEQHQTARVPGDEANTSEAAPEDLTQPLLSTDADEILDALPPTPPAAMTLASLLRHSYTHSLTLTEGLENIHPIAGSYVSSPRRSQLSSDAALPLFRTTMSHPLPSLPSSPVSQLSAQISQARPVLAKPGSPLRPARLDDARSAISEPADRTVPTGPASSSQGPEGALPSENCGDAIAEEAESSPNGLEDGQESSTGGAGPPAASFSQRHLNAWLHKGHWSGKKPSSDMKELESIRQGEAKQIPWSKVFILFAMFGGVLASDTSKARLQCGSLLYWLVVLSVVPFILALAAGVRTYLLRKWAVKERNGWVWTEGDVHWTPAATLIYPAICSLAGLVAGLFGIGGGVVKGPLMLEMNVLPDVAAATSATMILFTSLVGSLVFISFGAIGLDYGIAVFLIGLLSTLVGQFACYKLMQILKRRSIPILAMTGLMAMAMVGVWIQTSLSTWHAVATGHVLDFGTICGRTP